MSSTAPAQPAPPTRLDVPITGMHCAGCAHNVEQALQRVPGVTSAAVNFATARATVEYDPARAGPPELVQAVQQAGYGDAAAGARRIRRGRLGPAVGFEHSARAAPDAVAGAC